MAISIYRYNHNAFFPHTVLLLVGIGLGYGSLIVWSGLTLTVVVAGGAIALLTMASWFWQLHKLHKRSSPQPQVGNLLHLNVFLESVSYLDNHPVLFNHAAWMEARQWAIASQGFAQFIAQQEPTLLPELLETLHTVLDLLEEVANTLQITPQIQTPAYRHLVQQRLQESCDRLQATHHQLQHLHDQLALSTLERRAVKTAELPAQLRLLITENISILNSSSQQSV